MAKLLDILVIPDRPVVGREEDQCVVTQAVAIDGLEDPALRAQSIALLADIEADGSLAKYMMMALWAVFGEADRAFETAQSLDGIGQDFETGLELMFIDDLAILRQHGEFQQLLDSTGLTAYWAEVGCEWVGDRVRCDPVARN